MVSLLQSAIRLICAINIQLLYYTIPGVASCGLITFLDASKTTLYSVLSILDKPGTKISNLEMLAGHYFSYQC